MNKLKKQVLSILAASALVFPTPVMATTTLVISGNGSGSDSDVTYTTTKTTVVVQNNTATVTNNIEADAETGENNADSNVGGSVEIKTGDASTDVAVVNDLNNNEASVDCCDTGDTTVEVSMNGEGSKNDVNLTDINMIDLFQNNDAKIDNTVNADAETGENNADSNVGGDVSISSGKAKSNVEIYNTANSNTALIGAGDAYLVGGEPNAVDVRIVGNGPSSDNDVNVTLVDGITAVQDNDARVTNNVDSEAETGLNNADSNVGGEVMIETGDATTKVLADTAVNFNHVDADCGCVTDLLGKIDGNGTESKNDLVANLVDNLAVFQGGEEGNNARVDNGVEADAETGENGIDNNVAEGDGDPSILTGDADTFVDAITTGNFNFFGDMFAIEM